MTSPTGSAVACFTTLKPSRDPTERRARYSSSGCRPARRAAASASSRASAAEFLRLRQQQPLPAAWARRLRRSDGDS